MNVYRNVSVVLFVVLAVGLTMPAFSQSADGDATVENVTYDGDATLETETNETRIWRDGSHRFSVAVSSSSGVDGADLCLVGQHPNLTAGNDLACRPVTVAAGRTETVEVGFDDLPANVTGAVEMQAVVRSADAGVLDRASVPVTVLRRDADVDGDGLTNERETSLGTDLAVNDTDDDGLDDGVEVGTFGTDPTASDTDDDGLRDVGEIREYQTDPALADTDDDGLSDGREVADGTNPNVPDTDGDGLDDAAELSTHETNATAPDTDEDGLDDGVEVDEHGTNPSVADTDGDGLSDNLEIHTYGTDPIAMDTDDDGVEDGDEVFERRTDPTVVDTDGDGLTDGQEVNIYETNPRSADADGDGLDDGAEVRRFQTDPNAADTDGDGVGDRAEVGLLDRLAAPGLALPATVGLLVVLGGSLVAYRTGRSPVGAVRSALPAGAFPFASADGDGDGASGGSATGSSGEAARTASGGGSESDSPDGTGDASDAGPDDAPEPADVDVELLPNPDRVLTVLEANGGQMRQSALVDETGWSKAKVSRVLSRMEAEDQIVKVSVGRGNLVTTPNDVPSGVRSQFDDE